MKGTYITSITSEYYNF